MERCKPQISGANLLSPFLVFVQKRRLILVRSSFVSRRYACRRATDEVTHRPTDSGFDPSNDPPIRSTTIRERTETVTVKESAACCFHAFTIGSSGYALLHNKRIRRERVFCKGLFFNRLVFDTFLESAVIWRHTGLMK